MKKITTTEAIFNSLFIAFSVCFWIFAIYYAVYYLALKYFNEGLSIL